jgi:D-alanyl-D-alanine carboxypeptidase (penicillin-binding protein 5/6)
VIWCGNRGKAAAALVCAALALPVAIVEPASAAGPTPTPVPTLSASATPSPSAAAPSPTADGSAPIPCPKVAAPYVKRPPRPTPPPDVPAQRVVGGDQLNTSGLVIAPGAPQPPGNTAYSWLVADMDTGEILGACGPHEYGTPASVQKLLLVATLMRKLDPKQVVTVTHTDLAIKPGTSLVGLVEGGQYSIETLWLGLLLESGNDAANVLARLGGGSVAGGVQLMNEEARRLGALQSHAVTPSGLDGKGQFTSAYDLALIARACFQIDDFKRYTLTKTALIPAQPPKHKGFQIQNENKLIFTYPGALGGKTGFTDLARHTYVGMAERNGRRLVATLLGAEPRPQRGWQQGQALLDWGFTVPPGASVGRLVNPGEVAPDGSVTSAAPSKSADVMPAAAAGPVRVGPPIALLGGFVVAAGLLAGFLHRRRVRRR